MRELDKTKVYSLEDLTSEELNKVIEYVGFNPINPNNFNPKYLIHNNFFWVFYSKINESYTTHNAKELFYTLENIQVDCRELSEEKIKEIADVFEKAGYFYFNGNKERALQKNDDYYFIYLDDENEIIIDVMSDYKSVITYSKFMELFTSITTDSIQPHYDNTNGSIYKFCNDQKLNAWEFDIIKRVVRCRKKGLFKEDLQKTKDLIDLYLKEFTDEK